ncbi:MULTISPECIES: type II secretion system F family protein [Legionella]|uniref:Pilus assembly protein PilC n=1 Tax=Legionella drozanskii LLAP-1 TaxID=1212489 RepID=A0A0W0TDF1_9GAMM|nr:MULTISPECIES: type II secretion system F family protein [Legionella]KTC93667.1 pilus assembly protein PilC [Legionella drozanskii LLAP-1]PJE12696.1 MAG: type II secretion system F family protein [Legionella sp.]
MTNNTKQRYYWEGTNSLGEPMQGVINTTSLAFAKAELHKQGITSKKIIKHYQSLFKKKTNQSEIFIFCRQMATLLKSGIPLVQSLDILAKSQTQLALKWLIEDLKKQVENGYPFGEALRKYPSFNELVCSLISVGEKTGKLDYMLELVSAYKEKIERIKKKLKQAMIYPTVVLLVACVVSFFLLVFVVPQFESLFKNFGAKLPIMTSLVIQCSSMFRLYGVFSLFILLGLGYSLIQFKQRFLGLNQAIDKILLKLPLFGAIFNKAIIARFSRTLAVTFAAGFPLVNALHAAGEVTANCVYAQAIDKVREQVYTGQQMHLAMRNTFLFPNLVLQMIAIGEESGALESMLDKIADLYEEEVNNSVDTLSHLLEPIIMAILGLIIGTLVIAMYLPIFKLGSVV